MKYELDTLEKLAQGMIHGVAMADLSQKLLSEEERLPKAITENIFHLPSGYLVRQYICWHVDGLVKLADRLHGKAKVLRHFAIRRTLAVVLGVAKSLYHAFPEHLDTSPMPKVWLESIKSD